MARSCNYTEIGIRRKLDGIPRKFEIAGKVADTSNYQPYPVGCAIFSGKAPLSFGVNQLKSHPMQRKFNGPLRTFLHAEMHAITTARQDISGSKAYIARVRADGTYGNSRPCEGCMAALQAKGIKSVIYCDDGHIYEEKI